MQISNNEKAEKRKHRTLRKSTKRFMAAFCVLFTVVSAVFIASGTRNSAMQGTNNKQKTYQDAIANATPSTKAILSVLDTEQLENDLANNQIDYTRIGNTTYVLNYDSSDSAQTAVYETYANNEQIMANTDTIFTVSGTEKYRDTKKLTISEKENIPDGMILKDYCEQNGKKLVAVIDTGVNDYAAESKNFTDEKTASDENGHGTAVARTILDNSNGKAVILSLKAMKNDGTGYASDIIKAVQYAREQHVDVINMSISALDTGSSSIIKQFVSQAVTDGITVVASAGNFNSSAQLYVPANVNGVISVGAIDEKLNKIATSNYAAACYEIADSTSIAAAIHTGKIVSNAVEETIKDSDINYDISKADSSLVSECGRFVATKDNNEKAAVVEYGLNYSDDVKAKIQNSGAKYIISSDKELMKYLDESTTQLYDQTYNAYHYLFNSESEYQSAQKSLSNLKNTFVYGNAVNNAFSIQWNKETYSGWVNGRVWQDGSHTGAFRIWFAASASNCSVSWQAQLATNGWVGAFVSGGEHINVSIKRGNSTKQSINTTSYNGLGGDGKSGTESWAVLATNSFTDYAHNATYSCSVDFRNAGLSGDIGSRVITVSLSGLTPGYYLDLNFFDPSGTHRDDGSIGTANFTVNGSANNNVKDYYGTGLSNYSYSLSNISLNAGLKLSSVNSYSGAGVYENRGVEIKTAWSRVTVNPNGGSWNGKKDNTTLTASKVNDSFDLGTPTRAGYIFTGWSQSGGGSLNGNRYSYGNSDGSITANWKPNTYTLHYNENGGVLHDNAAKDGNKNTVTYDSADYWSGSSATRDHYTFDGFWTASSGGTQVFGADGNAVNGTGYWKNNVWCWAGDNGTIIELYAHWIPVSYPVDVNMILEHNNGTEQAAYSGVNDKDHNNVIALFDASASGSAENDVHDYYESLPYDSTITISNIRPQAGYYYKNSSGKWVPYGKSDGGQSYKLDENLKPYWDGSQWTIPLHMRPARQTVIYDLNEVATLAREGLSAHNGFERPTGAPAQQTIEYGTPTNLNSANTVWPGHTLRGWSTNANAATPEYTPGEANAIVDKLKTDGRITFYAVWDVSKTTLTVDQAEGTWTGTTPRTAQWGTSFDLGEPTPPNWTSTVHFDKNFEGDEAAEHYQLNGQQDVVLRYIFNKWVLQNGAKGFIETNGTHNVYYYQSTSDTATAKYYFQTTILPKPSRTGYTFLGWYRESGCLRKAGNNGDAYRSANDVRSETLYARWRKDVYTYKDTLEEYDRDDRDSTTGVFIRKVNGYSVPITTKGFTIALYKQGESTPVLRFKTGEGVYNSHNQLVNSTADTDGWYKVPDSISLPDGTYIAKEEDSLPGWTRDDDKTYTISRANKRTQIQMKDERFNIPNNPPVKKDDYGRQLSDVEFKLYDNTAKHDYGTVKFIKVEDDASHAHLDFESKFYQSLTATHSYTLTETKVPGGGRGFDAASYTFTVPKSGQLDPITITDPAVILGSLQVRKVNHDNQPLAGAKFQLMMKDADGNLIPCMRNKANKQWTTETDANTAEPMIVTTGTNGIATFSGLPVEANFTGSEPESCKSYYLKEIEAPAGYNKIDKVMEIRLSSDPTKQSVQQYTVKDGTITLTLDAGGNGIATYASAGSVMLAMALIVLMIRKSRKSAVKQN